MDTIVRSQFLIAIALGMSVAACGGGGERPTPGLDGPPPPSPQPAPPPSSTPPPLPPGPTGLVSAQPFATQSGYTNGWAGHDSGSDLVEISYSAESGLYTLTLPNADPGELHPLGGNGSFNGTQWTNLSSTSNALHRDGVVDDNVYVRLDHPSGSPFDYTSFGYWTYSCDMGCETGVFAYGTPTAAGDVPIAGNASYNGELRGVTDYGADVIGTVTMLFDFGGGTLSGVMRPSYSTNGFDYFDLGNYTFRDTVFAVGGTSFSGAFNAPNGQAGESWFSGIFTGPGAAELQASWSAPFQGSSYEESGRISGVWIARR